MSDSARGAPRTLFDRQSHGALCSAHHGLGGWPFGSIVPYAVLPSGDAVVFLSDIAEHTKNVSADGRVCLFIADPAAHAKPQAGARVAILARAARPSVELLPMAETCYFERFPAARAMRESHGFDVWRLEVDCVRWIAGFGEMGWIDRATWSGLPDPLAGAAAEIVAHMNEDHSGAVAELVTFSAGVACVRATVVSLDRGGYMAQASDREGEEHLVRLPFPTAVDSADAVRHATIAMLRAARRT